MMITQEEALNIIFNVTQKRDDIELIPFMESINRVLAEDVFADIDMPPYDKSAMDGYACRQEDLKSPLNVVEIIAAGKVPTQELKLFQCSKIMTGAPIPKGADTVIMIEHTKENENHQIVFTKEKTAKNICYKGEDFYKGSLLLPKGTLIKAAHIPIFATAGLSSIHVSKLLNIGVISTGDELVEPDTIPEYGKIRNTNAYQIMAQAKNLGMNTLYYGIADDTHQDTFNKISKSIDECDITILSGGVSAGDFDFVPKVITDCGFEILFKSIAVQPGRPTLLASKKDKFIFGLPGNPVSSFVQFELLVKPLVYKLLDCNFTALEIKVPFSANYDRKRSDRKAWIPVFVNQSGEAQLVEYNGSAHINAYINANAIMAVEIGTTEIKKGDLVNVRFI